MIQAKNMYLALLAVALSPIVWCASSARADIIPIDLNDFFADPEVTVSGAGDTASVAESQFFGSTLLSNDPGLGDPNVVLTGPGTQLLFDYVFTEAAGEIDEFFAAILDSTGFSVFGFEFILDNSGSGTVIFDLTSLILEPFLGLQFELVSFDGGVGGGQGNSTLTVSNVRLVTPAVTVPEPSTLALLGIGLFGMRLARRRRKV